MHLLQKCNCRHISTNFKALASDDKKGPTSVTITFAAAFDPEKVTFFPTTNDRPPSLLWVDSFSDILHV